MKRRSLLLQLDDAPAEPVDLEATGSTLWRARVGTETARTELSLSVLRGGARPILLVGGRVVSLWLHASGTETRVRQDGVWHTVRPAAARAKGVATGGRETENTIGAPMPGRVVQLHVREGDEVAKGAPLLVVEAMKMQNALFSPRAGRVQRVLVQEGQNIERGAPLLEFEVISDA